MKKKLVLALFCAVSISLSAQIDNNQFDQINRDVMLDNSNPRKVNPDSLGSDKEIPKGIKVWTVDKRFGDIVHSTPDTLSHMFMNSIFTTGLRGEFNTTGNLGAPRINRIFIDRSLDGNFIFTNPYDFFVTDVSKFHFTNTLSPFTNLTFNTCGDRLTGEDHFTAKFGVNAGKRLGFGFNFDYIYGRGYYSSQSTSHFNYTMYGSYLGDQYQAHLLMSTNHQKVTENGGITNDDYIVHPELFPESFATPDIPTVLNRNWNRNDNQHLFFTHRYSLGFHRTVKMTEDEIAAKKFAMAAKKDQEAREAREKAERDDEDFDEEEFDKNRKQGQKFAGRPDNARIAGNEPTDTLKTQTQERLQITSKAQSDSLIAAQQQSAEDTLWTKKEYVPVTSFIHTVELNNYSRIYQAYETPESYYANDYEMDEKYAGDSIYDKTRHLALRNTFALSLLEGFNKWAKAGVKLFAAHEMRRYVLPEKVGTSSWSENNIYIGGQLSKFQGRTLHYCALAEFGMTGEDAGNLKVDASADLNFNLFGDTVTLQANGFFHRTTPSFYYRHYHSRHYLWDNDGLSKVIHSRIQGMLSWEKTKTKLRVAFDEISNYTYFGLSYQIGENYNRLNNDVHVRQSGDAISLLTLQLYQDFKFGPFNWENVLTYQKSSAEDVLPVPQLNVYSNLYLRFKIAKVLKCDFGADVRYFTKYYAPDYAPGLGQYAVQEGPNRVEVGNYPILNVYANFHLKQTRFFVMMSHVNAGSGNKMYFLAPHYPLNDSILRFGLSWNFYN
ncbi:MAG TPA: hypothetical protein DCL18_06845 [Prevotella sp.]|nr:hypothetical protein [Prevotella sp.]